MLRIGRCFLCGRYTQFANVIEVKVVSPDLMFNAMAQFNKMYKPYDDILDKLKEEGPFEVSGYLCRACHSQFQTTEGDM